MKDQTKSSHECDALGGISKLSQKRIAPEDVVIRTDADLTKHLRERERANDATGSSVAGIPELKPHADKKDLPPTAPGKSTRVDRSSDRVISKPFSHVEHNKREKDYTAETSHWAHRVESVRLVGRWSKLRNVMSKRSMRAVGVS